MGFASSAPGAVPDSVARRIRDATHRGKKVAVYSWEEPAGADVVAATATTFVMAHWMMYPVLAGAMGAALAHFVVGWAVGLASAAVLLVPYAYYYATGPSPSRLGRPLLCCSQTRRWGRIHDYLRMTLVRTTPLEDGQYVAGLHPHGIMIFSRLLLWGGQFEALFPAFRPTKAEGTAVETTPQYRLLAATPLCVAPMLREMVLSGGGVDASRASAHRVMQAGLSMFVYPGGSYEIFETDPNQDETLFVLQKRRGFVRMAMQYGAPLVPCVAFGEKTLLSRFRLPRHVERWALKALRLPLVFLWGRCCSCLPHRPAVAEAPERPTATWATRAVDGEAKASGGDEVAAAAGPGGLRRRGGGGDAAAAEAEGKLPELASLTGRGGLGLVVGAPMAVERNEAPSKEEIAVVHAQYVEAVRALWNEYKDSFGYGDDQTLKID